MATQQFTLQGDVTSRPSDCADSGAFTVQARLDERLSLGVATQRTYVLDADAPFVVDLTEFAAGVHVLVVKVEPSLHTVLAVTSADGAAQVVPVETLHVTISRTVPITAITLTRTAGQDTTVRLFLGALAA